MNSRRACITTPHLRAATDSLGHPHSDTAYGMKPSEYDYLERPKQFGRDDFWRQVRRTVNGQPVTEDQIQLIVQQIDKGLALGCTDKVLDIGCGNGALTVRLEPLAGEILGVDYSEYLVEVAKEYFESQKLKFINLSIEQMIEGRLNDDYDKALLYGVSSYLSDELLERLVAWFIARRGSATFFIGNIRDKRYAADFYKEDKEDKELSEHTTSIGKWRTQEWFMDLAQKLGVEAKIMKMPDTFYLSKYYFDLVLTRR